LDVGDFGLAMTITLGYHCCHGKHTACLQVSHLPQRHSDRPAGLLLCAARWVWNTCLAWRTHAYRVHGERVTGVDFSRELTWLKHFAPYAWLAQVPATVLTQGLRDQDRAFECLRRACPLSPVQAQAVRPVDSIPARPARRRPPVSGRQTVAFARSGRAQGALV
jgi:hypothetical protein